MTKRAVEIIREIKLYTSMLDNLAKEAPFYTSEDFKYITDKMADKAKKVSELVKKLEEELLTL